MNHSSWFLAGAVALFVAACGGGMNISDASDGAAAADAADASVLDDGGDACGDARVVHGPFATRVVSFDPGDGAGFGQDRLPGVVLGPPAGTGESRGGTDVLSLGAGGRICVAFDDVAIVDGPGTDLIVFENAFIPVGTSTGFAELGEVSVSEDGLTFVTFPCVTSGPPYTHCAGWNPVYSAPCNGISPLDPNAAGGDPFDLADVGLARATVVCIHDLGTITPPVAPTAGFDLDAISAVHSVPR